MSGKDRFEAWWQTLNVYDPALKALAGSAWMEAKRIEESQVQKEITVSDQEGEIKLFEIWWKKHAGVMAGPPEFRRFCKRKARIAWLARASYDAHDCSDEDPWVTQDRVPARVGIDEYRYASFEGDDWRLVVEDGNWSDVAVHGWVDHEGDTLLLRCRLSQLPEVCDVPEQPAGDPDEWVVLDPVKYADHVPRVGIDRWMRRLGDRWHMQSNDHDKHSVGVSFTVSGISHSCRRRDLPKVEKPEPQPQKRGSGCGSKGQLR